MMSLIIIILHFVGYVWQHQAALVSFFSTSPKRQILLEQTIQHNNNNEHVRNKLISLSHTRWTEKV